MVDSELSIDTSPAALKRKDAADNNATEETTEQHANTDFSLYLPTTDAGSDKDAHYAATASPAKRPRVEEKQKDDEDDEDYHAALMHLNDTEQLQFLADQLKPTDVSTPAPEMHDMDVDQPGPSAHSTHGASVGGSSGSYKTTFTQATYNDLFEGDQISDPLFVLRIKSLPILDNLSTQILNTLGRGAYMDAIAIATQPETDQGQAFQILMSLFEQTKTIYCDDAFLNARELHLNNPREHGIVVQKTNLATFVSAVFGAAKVGFFHLNEHFLDTFVVENGRLLKPQGALFLDLKTQAYISAMGQVERSQKEILDDLFPEDMDKILLARKTNSKILAPSESDFVARCRRRRDHLAATDPSGDISGKYSWLAFVRDLSEYISKNSQLILTGKSARATASEEGEPRKQSAGGPGSRPGPRRRTTAKDNSPVVADDAHRRMSGVSMVNEEELSTIDFTLLEKSTSAAPAPAASSSAPAQRAPYYQRRPWTQEEEEALMSGLNAVQGPLWSQILELYGPGGRISEVLKDRNQVQLKDKARNLKLFFLKTGVKMPDVLRFVTGDVRTREKSAKRTRKNIQAKTMKERAQAQLLQQQQHELEQQQQQQHLEQQQQRQQASSSQQHYHAVFASQSEPAAGHAVGSPGMSVSHGHTHDNADVFETVGIHNSAGVPTPAAQVPADQEVESVAGASRANADLAGHHELEATNEPPPPSSVDEAAAIAAAPASSAAQGVPPSSTDLTGADHNTPAGSVPEPETEPAPVSSPVSAVSQAQHVVVAPEAEAEAENEQEDESANLFSLMQEVGEYLEKSEQQQQQQQQQADEQEQDQEPKEDGARGSEHGARVPEAGLEQGEPRE